MPPKEAEGEAPAAMKAGTDPKAEDTPGLFAPVPLPEESVDDRKRQVCLRTRAEQGERRAKEILASLVVSLGKMTPWGL